ncbi:HSP20-like chaperone [Meira miltonrushii]|uniref:HSP20-like chaperone n=1 Tax=Meira miltonrushii TaxID=1280837 RepID=A0A316VKZ1_9BASI|nr:HSP20-like chaperone [Meira miltonrushii]PWN38187.1 HSP20-like chaperone [Meira miltonrushii]
MSLFSRSSHPFDFFLNQNASPFLLLDPLVDASQAHNNITPARRGERSLFRDDFFNGPRCDLHATEKEFVLEAEIPGIPKDQIKLEVDEKARKITIAGEVKTSYTNQQPEQQAQAQAGTAASNEVTKTETKKEVAQAQPRTLISERSYGKIERSWVLPSTADLSKVTAKINDGILKVTIPFVQEQKVKPRAVTIEDAAE